MIFHTPRRPLSRVILSTLVCIVLASCHSSSNPAPPQDDATVAPTAPAELRADIYSAHEIELFWEAATDDGWVMGYDIYRNGELLAQRLDARSYFDDTVAPDSDYTYRVIAVDDDGNHGAPAEVTLATPPGETTINADNHVALLNRVFQILVGDVYNKPLLGMFDVFVNGLGYDGRVPVAYTCQNGGTAIMDSRWEFVFTDCQVGNLVYDGNHTQTIAVPGFYGDSIFSTGLMIDDPGLTRITYSGVGVRKTNNSRTDFIGSWDAQDLNFQRQGAGDDLLLKIAHTHFSSGYYDNYARGYETMAGGNLQFRSSETGQRKVNVETLEMFTYSLETSDAAARHIELGQEGYFPIGRMRLSADDGSELLLNADTGDDNTASITINTGGAVLEFLQPWSLWHDALFFDTANRR